MTGNPQSEILDPPNAQFADVGGMRFCYEDMGDSNHPVILLIMGLGTQLTGWPDEFCELLVGGGYRVIRFDNRDIGLSSKITTRKNHAGRKKMSIQRAYINSMLGLNVPAPYSLHDMAQDTDGLLDALGIEQAHLVGASMGGMIAQIVTAGHPSRVLSLTSVMSTTGSRRVPPGKARVLQRVGRPPPSQDMDVMIEHYKTTMRMIGSPGYPIDEHELTRRVERGLKRSYYPAGTARQLLAILSSGQRSKLLKSIQTPTLVLHGDQDPLIPLAGGKHTAKCIPGARLEVIKGMGHDLPPQLHERLADSILGHLQKVV